jgi:hypothetical protein
MCWVVARVRPKVLVKKVVVVCEHVEKQFALGVDVAHKGRTCSRESGRNTSITSTCVTPCHTTTWYHGTVGIGMALATAAHLVIPWHAPYTAVATVH